MKKIIALILALAALVAFAACGNEEDTIDNPNPSKPLENSGITVMSYEGETINSGMYAFIFSYLKTKKMYYFQMYGSSQTVEDTQSFWNTYYDGKTIGEAALQDIQDHCKMLLICNKMASEYNVSLNNEEQGQVEDELNDWISSYGSVEGLSDFLKRYGISVDDLEKYLEKNYLIVSLQNKLCSEGGVCEVTDDEVNKQINETYSKVTHIYLSDKTYNGDAKSKGEEILKALEEGKDIGEFGKLSEDTTLKTYPDGMMVSLETDNSYTKAVAELSDGEYALCEMGDGVYIIKCFKMTDSDVDSRFETVYKSVADNKFLAVMAERYPFVELNRDELDKYDIITADTIEF